MNGKFAKGSLIQILTIAMVFVAGNAFAAGEALMHNSQTTGSTKWGGSWGVAGGQYGEFTCTTCHSSPTTGPSGNIKKIVASIPATIGTAVVKPVTFNNMTGFGDDSASHATSTKICQVCHTQTIAHQYNTANAPQSGDLTHENGDCTRCHLHADGFKKSGHLVPLYATTDGHTGCASGIGCHTNSNPAAPYPAAAGVAPDCRVCHTKADPTTANIGCGSCHGDAGGNGMPSGANGTAFPNWSGSHTVHVAKAVCIECHTSGGTGGNADHGKGNRNANPAVLNLNATYGWTGTTCNTASCHANPYVDGGFIPAPAWGTKNNGCNACHSANPIGTNGPATGSHALNGHKVACIECHATGTTATTSATLANGHADGNIDVANVGYAANKTKGTAGTTCSAASCHANVYGTGNVTTPAWGTSVTGSCSICHNTQPITASGPATGSHAAHAAKSVACISCHAAGTTATSFPSVGHGDGNIDITYSGYPTNKTKGSAFGTCSNIACHTPTGYSTLNSATWGSTANCNTCHPKAGLSGAHQVHMGTLDLTSSSILYNMTANRTLAVAQVSETDRKHGFGCANCHPMNEAKHLDGVIDVDLSSKGVSGISNLRFLNSTTAGFLPGYTAEKKCDNMYCHSNASRIEKESNVRANTSLAWTETYAGLGVDRCASCHGNQPTTGAHAAHSVGVHTFNEVTLENAGVGIVLDGNIFNGVSGKVPITNKPNTAHGNPNNSTTISCYICHYSTVTSKANDKNYKCSPCHVNGSYNASPKGLAAISNLKNHVNGLREIDFPPVKVLSKAQIRPKGPNKTNSTFDFYSGVWERTSYKNMSTLSFDRAKVALNTATMWHYSSARESSCSNVSCHNNNFVKWNLDNFHDPNKCMDCHNAL